MSEIESLKAVYEAAASGEFLRQLSNVSGNSLPEGFPENLSLEETLFQWAECHVPEKQQTLFRQLFSVKALKEAFESGQTSIVFEYDDPEKAGLTHRLTLRMLSDDNGDVLCVSSLKEVPKSVSDVAEKETFADSSPFRAVMRSYLLFFQMDLSRPSMKAEFILRDENGSASSIGFPCTYPSFLKRISSQFVRAAWEDEFLSRFSLESLKDAVAKHRQQITHSFSSDGGTFRMDAFLPEETEADQICYLGLCRAEPENISGLTVAGNVGEAVHAAVEDLQLEMQMERDETRKKHHRHSLLLVLATVLIGIVGGAVLDQKIPAFSGVVNQFLPVEATEEPASTPPPVASEEVSIPETVITYVPFTLTTDFTAEIMENGTARINNSSETYESLSFSVGIAKLLDPGWFEQQYQHKGYLLNGSEAAVQLDLTFDAGETISSLVPQDAFDISIIDSKGNALPGYQLMDQALGGAYQVTVEAGTKAELYKRYDYSEDIRYLVLTYYQEAVRHEIWFALRYDDPNVEYETMKLGDHGPFVLAMKQKLAELGYLPEQAKTNDQFNQQTVNAVMAAQEALGMEATGTADAAFLQTLYRKNAEAEN